MAMNPLDLAALAADLTAAGVDFTAYQSDLGSQWIAVNIDENVSISVDQAYHAACGQKQLQAIDIILRHVVPAPPVTPGLLAAAQEYVAALDHQVNVFTREIDGEHLASIDASIRVGESLDALRAELAAATAGPAALTTDDAELGVSVRRLCELYSAVAEAIDRGFSPVAFARIRATFAEFTEHDANLISDAFGIYSDN